MRRLTRARADRGLAGDARVWRRPAQAARRQAARRLPPPPPPLQKIARRDVICPTPLGVGVNDEAGFLRRHDRPRSGGRHPHQAAAAHGSGHADLRSPQPPHVFGGAGARRNRAFARYTATIGVLTMDNTLISRAVVQNEFRTAADLVDRVGGGAGPGGVKAVAPTGTESITITIPEGEDQVSMLGEKLTGRAARRHRDLHAARPPDRRSSAT